MRLGVPGRIMKRWQAGDGALLANAVFAGEVRTRLNYVPDLDVGDFTIVHACYATTKVSAADKPVAMMRDLGLLDQETAEPELLSESTP